MKKQNTKQKVKELKQILKEIREDPKAMEEARRLSKSGNSETKRLENGLYPKAKQDQWTLNRVKSDKTENPDIIKIEDGHWSKEEIIAWCKNEVNRARKQTAEEIFKELDDWWYEGGKSSFSTAEYESIKKKYLGGGK